MKSMLTFSAAASRAEGRRLELLRRQTEMYVKADVRNALEQWNAAEIRYEAAVTARRAAEARLRELLDGHILELRRAHSVSALEQLRSHFLHREWNVLKGVYPELHREGEREAEKLLLRLEYETDVRRKRGR